MTGRSLDFRSGLLILAGWGPPVSRAVGTIPRRRFSWVRSRGEDTPRMAQQSFPSRQSSDDYYLNAVVTCLRAQHPYWWPKKTSWCVARTSVREDCCSKICPRISFLNDFENCKNDLILKEDIPLTRAIEVISEWILFLWGRFSVIIP